MGHNGEEDHEEPSSEHDEPEAEPEPVDEEPEPAQGGLREGFYDQSCPRAEIVVNEVINKHFRRDPSLAPALVRLFFHDCFVTVRGPHSSVYMIYHFFW